MLFRSGEVQGRPEAVARPGEMVTGRCRIESRVDAAEENAQVRPDHIRDSPACGGEQLRPVGAAMRGFHCV